MVKDSIKKLIAKFYKTVSDALFDINALFTLFDGKVNAYFRSIFWLRRTHGRDNGSLLILPYTINRCIQVLIKNTPLNSQRTYLAALPRETLS